MACFTVPLGQAIAVTVVKKVIEKKEKKAIEQGIDMEFDASNSGITWSRRLGWLNKMLWGGSFLLAIEHIWHGEVVPWPPFITAMNNPAEIEPMLHEVATVGTAMSIFVTLVWIVMVLIAELKIKATTSKSKNNI